MPRRHSDFRPLHGILVAAVLAALGFGYWWMQWDSAPAFAGSKFSAVQFRDNYLGMRGNTYVVVGTITEQLRYGADGGRLYSLAVNEGGEKAIDVGILVPPSFQSENIQVGQEFSLQVTVDSNGLLVAQKLRKT
jgi:hypothetical protein